MKTLIYWRHSVKGTGDHSADIMQEGLAKARERAEAVMEVTNDLDKVSHFFAGPMKRTWQTLAAIMVEFMEWGIMSAEHQIHEEVPAVGTQKTFDDMKAKGVQFYMEGKTVFQAVKAGLSTDDFANAALEALKGVADMMTMMADDEVGLAVGHSPIIELAAHAAGLDMTDAATMPENGYIVFTVEPGDPIRAHFPS